MQIVIWSTLVLGGWLVISPFTIPYVSGAATAEDVVCGMLIVATSMVAVVRRRSVAPVCVLLALGVWAGIAPFILGYYNHNPASDAVANDMVVGSVVVLLALIRLIVLLRPQVTELD